jgi:hypothetical protein
MIATLPAKASRWAIEGMVANLALAHARRRGENGARCGADGRGGLLFWQIEAEERIVAPRRRYYDCDNS